MDKINNIIENWIVLAKLLNHGYGVKKYKNYIRCEFWSKFNKKDNLIQVYIDNFCVLANYDDYINGDYRHADSDEIGTEKVVEEITRWISLL